MMIETRVDLKDVEQPKVYVRTQIEFGNHWNVYLMFYRDCMMKMELKEGCRSSRAVKPFYQLIIDWNGN